MIQRFLAALVVVLIGFTVYLYLHLGVSKPVQITVGERGPLLLLAKSHRGAYHYIGPVIAEVETWARAQNLHCPLTFGEYVDDPAAVEQDRLRSAGGCVLSSAPASTPEGFTFEERAAKVYVIAKFSGSPSIGPFKVYPKVQEYLAERRLKSAGPVIELYRVNGSSVTTEFLFPLENPPPTER